jgi:growth arrest and DNA-damage-inducible protein
MVKEFNKSLSNTSTTSVESGIFDVDFEPNELDFETKCAVPIGETVKEILTEANNESRLICGWKSAINYLNETEYPEHSLFFFLVPSANNSDCISHIQEVMMKAFCLDNDIYVIQLDSVEKLNALLGSAKNENHQCALVQRSSILKCQNQEDEIDLDEFSEIENALIDYCEEVWTEPVQPIIRLPEK